MKTTDIRIDGFAEGLGVDGPVRVSWKLAGEGANAFQKACKIRLKMPDGSIPETPWTETSCHQGMAIPQVALESFQRYEVQILVEDLAGVQAESDWTAFVTGAIRAQDFAGQWIGKGDQKPFYARKEHRVEKKIVSAYGAVCGLGQFLFYINGRKVSNHELDPGWTNYNKKVQYVVFDIAPYLTENVNAFGISVGNGFYLAEKGDRYFFELPAAALRSFMPPNTNGYEPFGTALALKAMILIRYADGSQDVIATDPSWQVQENACILANVYGSEIYDGRKYPAGWNRAGFDGTHWQNAVPVEAPKGKLSAQGQPPIVIKKTYTAKLLEKQENGWLYDFGQNMSCLLELAVKGAAGQRVDLLVAEKLDGEGKIDQVAKNWDLINVSSTYILAGKPEYRCWKQEFSYVGCRYVLVKGIGETGADLPELLELKGHYIVSDSPVTGTFCCDDARYNQVYQLIIEAIDSNLKSVHTDCPTIEKTAWLEESHLLAPAIMYYRDVRDLWSKMFDDAVIDQYTSETKENGMMGEPVYRGAGFLPPIAPAYGKMIMDTPVGNFWDLIAWSSFPILAAKWYYRYYGDPCMIYRNYDAGCKYMDYLAGKLTSDGFIAHGLGDWGNPQAGGQATANVETAFYYEDLITMAEFARLLGKPADEETFTALAEKVRDNYNEKLLAQGADGKWCYRAWDHPDEIFCTQACQALPLHLGMVPEEKRQDVLDTLMSMLDQTGFVSGEVGFPALLHALKNHGAQDLIWQYAMKEDTYSFYHFIQSGETALCEYWEDNPRSHNHDMMGSLLELYYSGLAGIRCLAPGFTQVAVRPHLSAGIHRMQCSYNSVQGTLAIQVEETGVSITVPAGMKVTLDLQDLGMDVQALLLPGSYRYDR